MVRVAVIGGMGQLGTDLVRVLQQVNSYRVFPLSHAQVECTEPDSVQRVFSEIRPDIVVNCAAFVHVDECENRPEEALRVNALGALHVARACAELNSLCVYVSSDYVFDGKQGEPYTEEDTPLPLNVYGTSKLAGEYFVRSLCSKHLVLRASGLYGVTGSSGKGGNFVETMIRLAKEREPIRVVNNQVLTPTYTKDLAHTIKELLQTEAYGLYHVTNSGQCSWYEFAAKIFELLGLKPDFAQTTAAEFGSKVLRPPYSVLAHDGLKRLGLMDLRPWPEALKAYLQEKGYLTF